MAVKSNAPTSAAPSLLQEMERELHDLSQPLTALHFRLELGKFAGDPDSLREAVDGALEETTRMIDAIKSMRERVAATKSAQRHQSSPRGFDPQLHSPRGDSRN